MRISPRLTRGPEKIRTRRTSRDFRPELSDLEPRLLLAADPFQPTAYEQYMLQLINQVRANPAAAGQQFVRMAETNPVLKAATANWNLTTFLQEIDSFGPEPPLAFNTRLIEAARDHDAAMLAANSQFHAPTDYLTNTKDGAASDGQAYFTPLPGTWYASGENIFAYSSVIDPSNTQATVDYFNAAFFLDWGNPDFGHLKNLLAPGPGETNVAAGGLTPFSEIGVGLLTNVAPSVAPGTGQNPANQGFNVGPDLVTQEFAWDSGIAFLTGAVFNDSQNTNLYEPGEGIGGVTIQAVGTNGQGTFQTTTWDAGGYSLQLPPGTYAVTASGGSLSLPQSTVVTIGQDNVPWNIKVSPQTNADQPVPGNYNGDGKTDLAVYRPTTAQWFIAGQSQPIQFGWAGVDIPEPGNYDGTGQTEIAVYRPTTAQWFIAGHAQPISFGWAGVDIPVPGDYDGTGQTEIAVYRPTTAQWFILGPHGVRVVQFGEAGVDIPVPGNYDGTGRDEIAVYRPTTAQWFIAGHAQPVSFGWAGVDLPVPGNYDGTGHAEIAVYRPTNGDWFIAGHAQPVQFGLPAVDVPVAGDFGGDGKSDMAVFRPTTGQWFYFGSTVGAQGIQFGQGGTNSSVSNWLIASALTPSAPVSQFAIGAGPSSERTSPREQSPASTPAAASVSSTTPGDPDNLLSGSRSDKRRPKAKAGILLRLHRPDNTLSGPPRLIPLVRLVGNAWV